MKRLSKILVFLAIACACRSTAAKDTCRVGLYITSLYDFKIKEKSFNTSFWLWRVYKDTGHQFDFARTTEVVNAKKAEFGPYQTDDRKPYIWSTQQVKAEVRQDWKVGNYPFDHQKLVIELEDSHYDLDALLCVADTANSRMDPGIHFGDFHIAGFRVYDQQHKYPTTYGDPNLKGSSSYSRIVAEITLERKNSWRLLVMLITGLVVAFAIALSSLYISPKHSSPRMGLCVGGLFSSVGSKYVTENIVPPGSSWTLVGNLHNLTFIAILVIIIVSIRSIINFENGKLEMTLGKDRNWFRAILGVYSACFALLIALAAWSH
ncbi:MAG: hypothetical protein JNL57_07785 [Bacteroidetes bacterium]|nr:hypothetical protein [Bacteroidota bacterium]